MIDPPAISSQPSNRTNNTGTTATFTVVATGTGPLNYQWKKDGTDLLNSGNVSGADSDTLTLSAVSAGDAGLYTVGVTNAAGGLLSSGAALTVVQTEPPQIQGIDGVGTGTVTITWSAVSGATYRVQYTSDLSGNTWTDLSPDVTANGNTASITDTPGGADQRFYRVILVQ